MTARGLGDLETQAWWDSRWQRVSLGDMVLGMNENQEYVLRTADDGQAESALGCPVLPPPCHLCFLSSYFHRHICTQPWVMRQKERQELQDPRGDKRQGSKPARGRDGLTISWRHGLPSWSLGEEELPR